MIPGLGTAAAGRVGRPAAVPAELPAHLSVSQIETLSDCGMKYKLQRLDGIQEIPAWWNVGGTAFHSTIEWWERQYFATGVRPGTGQSLRMFGDVFQAGVIGTRLDSPGIPESQWRAAGSGKEDEDWWRENGALMVTKYVAAHQDDGPKICAPYDQPAVELEFELDVDGISVKGFIDQVRYSVPLPGNPNFASFSFHITDLKAGRNTPGSTFQLGVYGQALRRVFGVSGPISGRYWMARKGAYTEPVDLDKTWPWESIVHRTHLAERQRRAGIFPIRESSFCGSCSVNDACPTRTGVWPKL